MHFGPRIAVDGCVASIDGSDNGSFEVLIVAGGGGGGMDMGGGGGGGGVLYFPATQVDPGVAHTVTVGAGGWGAPAAGTYRGDGAGPQPAGHQYTISATQGGNSVFGPFTAIGGGFGASSYYGYTPNYGYGGTGGSGGGCSGYTHGGERYVDGTNGSTPNNVPGQGFPGGNSGNPASGADDHYSGGGGGAGGRGTSGPNHLGPNGTKPNGGIGIENSILGTSYFWAGGGGGSAYSTTPGGDGGLGGGGGGAVGTTTGGAGLNNGSPGGGGNPNSQTNTPGGNAGANTGGGGGGGSHYNSNNKGGDGGSGIVVVAYKGPQRATGGTIDTSSRPGFTLHKYTSTGNSTFTPYAVDTASNLYHCTFNGNAYFTRDGGNGGVFVFDGSGDYLVNTSFNRHQQSTGTIMAWAYPTAISGDYYLLGAGGTGTLGATRALRINSNNWSCVTYGSGGVQDYDGITNATVNTWQHAVFVWNGTTVNFYLNGNVSSVTRTGLVNPSGTTFSIGAPPWALTSSNWAGKIACARVYDRALSTAEVQTVFNSTRKRFNV